MIGPPNVPEDKADEYRDAALNVGKNGGYLPNGSDAKLVIGLARLFQPLLKQLQGKLEFLEFALKTRLCSG